MLTVSCDILEYTPAELIAMTPDTIAPRMTATAGAEVVDLAATVRPKTLGSLASKNGISRISGCVAALCRLGLEAPAPVIADALGIRYTTATRHVSWREAPGIVTPPSHHARPPSPMDAG
ncbi:hypothetical protein [Actinosynnema sp. NPDC023587]|uniref:hypothetical protein n=1 Tax=Actinosynnema sp. NPDC023587 TaxID=3154695 RepID=UPI0033C869F1